MHNPTCVFAFIIMLDEDYVKYSQIISIKKAKALPLPLTA